MSKKCPHCGSYNTEIAFGKWAERGFVNAFRGVAAVGVGSLVSLFHPGQASAFAAKTWQNMKQPELEGYYCCGCKRYFPA